MYDANSITKKEIPLDHSFYAAISDSYSCYQAIGTRKNQQDCIKVREQNNALLAVLCDGMGGLSDGASASIAAVNKIMDDFERLSPANGTAFLIREAALADEIVYDLRDAEGVRLNCGTTLAAVLLQEHRLHYVSVGDSRIYLMRGKEFVQVTEDHNYRLTLTRSLQKGLITEEIFREEESFAEALISYVGMGGLKVIDCSNEKPVQLLPGDKLLLCSDGLYKCLSTEEIAEELYRCNGENIGQAAERLVQQATVKAVYQNRPQDNTSAIVLLVR